MARNELGGVKREPIQQRWDTTRRSQEVRSTGSSGRRICSAFCSSGAFREHSVYHWRRGRPHVVRAVEAAVAMVGCVRGGDAGGGGYGPDSALCSAIPGKGSAGGQQRGAG